ncbi:hypothetical protein H1R20_g16212, partial [Candolleomyces eurysporus]
MLASKKIDKLRGPDDTSVKEDDAHEDDMVILVMGPTGVGKSTFINNLANEDVAKVSDGYSTCTTSVRHYFVEIPQEFIDKPGRLVLVDTPAFNDSTMSPAESLRSIAWWLASSAKKWHVGGIIYMQSAYPHRVGRSDIPDLQVFRAIWGTYCASRIILATTQWGFCQCDHHDELESVLSERFWGETHQVGVKGFQSPSASSRPATMRLENSPGSAWEVVRALLELRIDNDVVLSLQREIVDDRTSLKRTRAAKALRIAESGLELPLTNFGISPSFKHRFTKRIPGKSEELLTFIRRFFVLREKPYPVPKQKRSRSMTAGTFANHPGDYDVRIPEHSC